MNVLTCGSGSTVSEPCCALPASPWMVSAEVYMHTRATQYMYHLSLSLCLSLSLSLSLTLSSLNFSHTFYIIILKAYFVTEPTNI